jgi:hypothetical protein
LAEKNGGDETKTHKDRGKVDNRARARNKKRRRARRQKQPVAYTPPNKTLCRRAE